MFRSHKKALGQGLKCKVQLLVPGEEIEVNYSNNSIGQDIMYDVIGQLDLLDKDYYGLKLYDHIQWLDQTKSVVKQTKGFSEVVFALRFKYYPAEPALLANESTRYYLYLQLRDDLLEGRLRTDSRDMLAYLIACILQSELGDASAKPGGPDQYENYVSEYKFVPNQDEELELAAIKLHQSEDFLGLRAADAELNFLKMACQLETYGIDPYPVKEGNSQKHFLIGVNHLGISTFQDSRRTSLFEWGAVERISLDSKLVLIYCRRLERKGEKTVKSRSLFAFRCPSHDHAQNFWKVATEHSYFFTLETTPNLPIVTNTGGLFRKNHKLRYVGRVEKDVLRDNVDEVRSSGVKRSRSLMAKTSNGTLWQGFQQSNINPPGSMNNIYSSNLMNKTLPSSMNYFREEDEDCIMTDEQQQPLANEKSRHSQASLSQQDYPKTFNRRPNLTTKSDASRRGSKTDADDRISDFKRASIFLVLVLGIIVLIFLVMSDADRPNSVTLLMKKTNLDYVSNTLRQNYFLPLKLTLQTSFGQIFSILDTKIM